MKLQQLFIFNPTLSVDEDTADENILCYYPPDTSLDWQMNEVGFCTAIVRMQERFGAVASIGCPMGITLNSKRYVIVKVEPHVFVTVIINREAFRNIFKAQAHQVTVWDSGMVTPLQDDVDEVAQEVVAKTVVTYYRTFAMMFGSITSNYAKIFGTGAGGTPASSSGVRSPSLSATAYPAVVGKATASAKATAAFRKSADVSGKKRQQSALRAVIATGLLDKLVPVLKETMKVHDLEGTFATPAGVEVLPLFPDTYLQITALMGQLSTAHASSVTNAVVSVGSKVAYSSLSVEDTATLFQLMLLYEEKTREDTKKKQEKEEHQQKHGEGGSDNEFGDSATSSPHFAEEAASTLIGGGGGSTSAWYHPDQVLRSEQRRSEFLWTRQSDRSIVPPAAAGSAAAASRGSPPSAGGSGGGGSGRSLSSFSLMKRKHRRHASSSGDGAGSPQGAYPFIFINDEPRGVITMSIGAFKIFLLVRDKFLQHPQLREGLISSVEHTLRTSHVGTPLQHYASPGADKAKLLDSIVLFHFESLMIKQVKSSIVARLMPAVGSLCAPASLPTPPVPLRSAERVVIHRLDMLRQAVSKRRGSRTGEEDADGGSSSGGVGGGHAAHGRGDSATLCRITDEAWASCIALGPRALSTALLGKPTVAEAEAALSGLINYVFYFSLKPLA